MNKMEKVAILYAVNNAIRHATLHGFCSAAGFGADADEHAKKKREELKMLEEHLDFMMEEVD